MFTRTFSKTFSSNAKADAVFQALLPETGAAHERRAKTRITVKKNQVKGTIVASDAPAGNASKQNYETLLAYVSALDE